MHLVELLIFGALQVLLLYGLKLLHKDKLVLHPLSMDCLIVHEVYLLAWTHSLVHAPVT